MLRCAIAAVETASEVLCSPSLLHTGEPSTPGFVGPRGRKRRNDHSVAVLFVYIHIYIYRNLNFNVNV